MTRRKPKHGRSDPNYDPVSPKRGLASGARSLAKDRQPSQNHHDSPDVDGLAQTLDAFRTARTSGVPSSSQSSKPQTQAAKPTGLASRKNAKDLHKRQWTVVRELGTKDNGKTVTVQWKDTEVSGKYIETDENDQVYVVADNMKHYIARQSHAKVDKRGRAWWNCKWENSDISKELLMTLPRESPSASESESTRTPSASPSPPQPSSPPLLPSASSSPSQARISIESLTQAPSPAHPPPHFGQQAQLDPDGLRFAVESDMLDYGPAVEKIIEQNIGDRLCTTTGKAPPVVQRRVGNPRVRALLFEEWTVGHDGHHINLRDIQNAEAVQVQMQGDEVQNPCHRCRRKGQGRGHGVMQGCIVADDFGKGECANCHYGSRATKCSFRKDTTDEKGYRAAVRLTKKNGKEHQPRTVAAPKPSSSNQPATSQQRHTPDWHANLHFSERDFVYSAAKNASTGSAGSSVSNDFEMSGGLGDRTLSPVATTKKASSRSRSRSPASDDDDDLPRPKRPRNIDTVDLTSSPEMAKAPKSAAKQVLRTPTRREKKKEKRRLSRKKAGKRPVGVYTPPSSPAPSHTDSPDTAWKQAKREINTQAVSWPPLARKGDGGTPWTKMKQEMRHAEGARNNLKSIPAVSSPEIATSGHATASSAARLQQRKQKGSAHPVPASSATSGRSVPKPSSSSSSTSADQAASASHRKNQRPSASSSARGHATAADASASQRKKQTGTTTAATAKKAKRKAGHQFPLSGSGPLSREHTADRAKAGGSHANQKASRAAPVSAPPPTRPHTPRGTSTKDSRSRIPAHLLPDPKEQAPVYSDQRFARNTLSRAQFSFVFHRCGAQLQDDLCHYLRWARYEEDVSRSMSLAKFYSGGDRMREWLNECVIPTVCPPRPKRLGVGVVDLVGDGGSSSSESEDEDDEESVIVAKVYEDSEWVGWSNGGQSDGSGSESETETDSSDDDDDSDGE